MKNKFLLILIIIFACSSMVVSQKPEPSGLILEVTFADKNLPHSNIVARTDKPSGVWFARFPRLPEVEKTLKKSDLVRAIDLFCKNENGSIKLEVSVYTGERYFDDKILVASYSLNLNDEVSVKELEKFGVKPIKIAVVKVAPTVASLPTVVNETESLQVIIEPNYSTLPTFKYKIINNSGKSVKALHLQTRFGKSALITGTPRNLDGRDLIGVGEIYENTLSNDYLKYSESGLIKPDDNLDYTFNIIAAVFGDGSYEGDRTNAGTILGYYQSEQIYLKRTIPILYELLGENDLDKISLELSGINTKVNNSELQNLSSKYPDIFSEDNPKSLMYIQSSVNNYKRRLIIEFNQIKRDPKKSFEIKNWLENTISNLEMQLKGIDFIK